MQTMNALSEDEVIATFLQGELDSSAFNAAIHSLLARHGFPEALVRNPDVHNTHQNHCRAVLLEGYRGYIHKQGLFSGFPSDVEWKKVTLDSQELGDVHYINESFWQHLTRGSRRAADGAKTVANSPAVPDFDRFRQVREAIDRGAAIPEIILVSTHSQVQRVVLEGHARLTAYLLDHTKVPQQLAVILGSSDSMHQWAFY